MVKSFKFIVNTFFFFEGLTGYVCERKMYQNSIQIDTQIHVKVYEIRRRNYVRKSITNNSENHSTSSAIKHQKTFKKH